MDLVKKKKKQSRVHLRMFKWGRQLGSRENKKFNIKMEYQVTVGSLKASTSTFLPGKDIALLPSPLQT